MKVRLIHEIGTRASLRVYWSDDCPNNLGTGHMGCHNAQSDSTHSLAGQTVDLPDMDEEGL